MSIDDVLLKIYFCGGDELRKKKDIANAKQTLLEIIFKEKPKKEIVVSEYKGKPIVMSKERQQEFKEDLRTMIGFNQGCDEYEKKIREMFK